MENLKLGFVPIGKFVFSHIDAMKYKKQIEEKLKRWNINYVSMDKILPDGMVRDQKHVEVVIEFLNKEKVDGVFIPHCNFGTEGAAGMIAKKSGVPVLLWGPRDEEPLEDGTRLRDTLCGLFATSKVLHKLNVPFTYIENCRIEDIAFKEGVEKFMSVISVVKEFKNMRLGQIGSRIDFFWTTIINESELLEKFGIEILPIDIVDFIKQVKENSEKNKRKYIEEFKKTKEKINFSGFENENSILNLFSMRDVMFEIANKEKINAYAIQSFMSICKELGVMVEFAAAMVSDEGIPVAAETDIHGAISSIILQASSFNKEKVFLADLTIRHPKNDNAVLLWHCSSPISMIDKDCNPEVSNHWVLPGIPSGSCHWKLKDGEMTILRFDGDKGEYKIICGEGKNVSGPYTKNVYAWLEVKNWKQWEKRFIESPYIHHIATNYGKYTSIIEESVKYLPGNIKFEKLD
ncbi:MAG TPA: fucose isomerase [Candidatus Ratteibacteria bacterium]|nr:fucose isomerase [Candidatus Ratteibacteria bacterium]